jgi:sugar lactone lactonase YvrE/lysophospholipase L1-like esterase
MNADPRHCATTRTPRSSRGVQRLRRSHVAAGIVATCTALALTVVAPPAMAAGQFVPIASGDMVASLASGQVNEYTPAGALVQTLIPAANTPTGSAFDGAGNLYVTEFGSNDILKVDAKTGAVSVFSNNTILADGTSLNSPESIAFGPGYTRMFVSDANRNGPNGGIHVIDTATGKGHAFLPLPSSNGSSGVGESDWLAFNHSGTLFMTNENPTQGVMQVNQSTGDITQPSFAANFPNDAYAMSFDTNDNLWVSDTSSILEFDKTGKLLRTISNPDFGTVFAAVFNPPFNAVYAGDLSTGNIFTYDLNGTLVSQFNAGSGIDGLSVAGTVLVPPVGQAGRYVALGDSYSSGEGAIDVNGNPSFLTGTDTNGNKCHRSANAYSEKLKNDLGIPDNKFSFQACSGAVVAEFVKGFPTDGNWNEKPQLDVIAKQGKTDPSVGLVTLSVGGNDVGFVADLLSCVYGNLDWNTTKHCAAVVNENLKKGLQHLTTDELILFPNNNVSNWQALTHRLPLPLPTVSSYSKFVMVPSLAGLYEEIHRRAPNARIVVMGYPELFPSNASTNCVVGSFLWAHHNNVYKIEPASMTALDTAERTLNTTIKNQVDVAKSNGVPNIAYVDTYGAFKNHGPCDTVPSNVQFINRLIWDGPGSPSPFSFHPNQAGQADLARQLLPETHG